MTNTHSSVAALDYHNHFFVSFTSLCCIHRDKVIELSVQWWKTALVTLKMSHNLHIFLFCCGFLLLFFQL